MTEEQNKTAGEGRDGQGRFLPGVSGNLKGGNSQTEEEKIAKKAIKELVKEYQKTLAGALKEISPVLIAKALEGDVPAIRELHDRVMGKAPQKTDITSGGDKIVIGGFDYTKPVKNESTDKTDNQTGQGMGDTEG